MDRIRRVSRSAAPFFCAPVSVLPSREEMAHRPPATTGRATVVSCTHGVFPDTVCMLVGRGAAIFYELII